MVMMLLCIGSVLNCTLAIFTLPSKNVLLFSLNLGLIGITVIPIIPVSYAFAVELTFPVQEAISNGMMILAS
jgi:hypothetical protein